MSHWLIVAMALAVTTADARQSVPTAGIAIEGRVVDAVTRQPLRGAIVRANLARGTYSTAPPEAAFLTGYDGRFVFRVAAGTIGLHASKTGYLSGDSDQLTLAPGKRKNDIEIPLTPEALISGRVVDQSGDPVENVTVRAVRKGEEAQFDRAESATTDDTGSYLIGSLEAGDYVVGIAARSTSESTHPVVFFPAASRPEDATAVQTSTGAERDSVDFMLRITAAPSLYRSKDLLSDDPTAGTIAGTVRDTGGRGLSQATVVLIRVDGESTGRQTGSDEHGRFEFANVPPGRFRLLTLRSGYSPPGGDPNPSNPAIVIQLRTAERLTDVALTMVKRAAISGTLTDHFGDPLAGTVTLRSVGAASRSQRRTNPRGQFRIGNVLPGDYLVVADQNPYGRDLHMLDESGQVRRVAMLPVYYPGVPEASLATPATVTPDREFAGINIVVRPQPVTTIDVTIDPGGRAIQGAYVVRTLHGPGAAAVKTSLRANTMQVTLDTVPAGRIVLGAGADEAQAEDGTRGRKLWSTLEVTSDGVTPLAVTLVLEPSARVIGRVVFDGASPPPSSAQVSLRPVVQTLGTFVSWRADVDIGQRSADFVVADVLPGQYVLQAADRNQPPAAWVLKSATISGREVFDDPFDIAPNADFGPLVVTLTDRLTEISGSVTDAAGRPLSDVGVIAFSADARKWRPGSSRVKPTAVDTTGHYVIRGLPPGDYRLAILPAMTPPDVDVALILQKLLPQATPVALLEGERKIQHLRRQN